MDATDKADKFLAIFRDLCLSYNRELDFPQVMSYYSVLKELDLHSIAQAALRLRKTSQFFPALAEWHRVATAIAIDALDDQPVPAPTGAYHCAECQDSGFSRGSDPRYVRMCACRATNPELKRQRDILKKLKG